MRGRQRKIDARGRSETVADHLSRKVSEAEDRGEKETARETLRNPSWQKMVWWLAVDPCAWIVDLRVEEGDRETRLWIREEEEGVEGARQMERSVRKRSERWTMN